MIYFDQAASSFPKPPAVINKMMEVMNTVGANPGRGEHQLARKAANIINETRVKAANLFGCTDPKKCLFYQNATVALNQAIKGLSWRKGDHIIATSFEHNSVSRPLEYIKQKYGVIVSYVNWGENNDLFIKSIDETICKTTKLIVMTHASNVTGSVFPIDKVIGLVKDDSILTLIDASQTAGHLPIDMGKQGIDMLVFPGHKGLLGPQGTGMLLVEGNVLLEPLHHGGTGVFSEDLNQPAQWPEGFESGTMNTPGIAGLLAAFISYEERRNEIVSRETILVEQLLTGLNKLEGVTCFGPDEAIERMPIVAFNIMDIGSQEIAMVLDTHYNIAVRGGLQCSRIAHETLGTTEQGVVRVSLGIYNTTSEVTTFLAAIEEIITVYKDL